MTQFANSTQSLQWLRVGDLTVRWTDAQRALSERRAKQIAEEFDPDMFGTLTVSELTNGKYHVNDGWTRASAIKILYGNAEKVPCVVVPADSAARAAEIFLKINGGRSKPSAMEMYHVAVTCGSAAEVAVHKIMSDLGLRIDLKNLPGSVAAVGAVLSIYRQHGGNGLRVTLQTVKDTWGSETAAFDAHIIKGFAIFLARHNDKVDALNLTRKVAKKFTPGRLVGSAKATREAFGGSLAKAVSALLVEAYNAQRHQGRLGEPDAMSQRMTEPPASLPPPVVKARVPVKAPAKVLTKKYNGARVAAHAR